MREQWRKPKRIERGGKPDYGKQAGSRAQQRQAAQQNVQAQRKQDADGVVRMREDADC